MSIPQGGLTYEESKKRPRQFLLPGTQFIQFGSQGSQAPVSSTSAILSQACPSP